MAKRTKTFPLRVVVIASVIVVALGTMLVTINRLGRPAELPPAGGEIAAGDEIPLEIEAVVPDAGVIPIMTIQLFVADPSGRELVTRIVRVDEPPTPAAQVELALLQLAAAQASPMPPNVVIREIWVANGIAYLAGGSRAELMFVYGVVGTLTSSVPSVGAVQFLVNGGPVNTLTGHTHLAEPVEPLGNWSF